MTAPLVLVTFIPRRGCLSALTVHPVALTSSEHFSTKYILCGCVSRRPDAILRRPPSSKANPSFHTLSSPPVFLAHPLLIHYNDVHTPHLCAIGYHSDLVESH